MMPKRILFTGGTGKAGRHVLPWLLNQGYQILNFDLQPFAHPGMMTLLGDITDGAQVFNAMTTHLGREGLRLGKAPGPVDAVVHFAAIPRIFINPDNETYRVNVMGTYNVIEAAMKLGIRKVIIASSETTYGVCFAEGDKDFHSFPLEEDYDVDPMDSYGLSKVVNERTARAFAARFQKRYLRLAHRQRHRTTRLRSFSWLRRKPTFSQTQCLELYRCPRPCSDCASVPAEGRVGVPDIQRGQRHDYSRPTNGGVPGPVVPADSSDTTARRQRSASFQPEGQGDARLQGTAQLA